MISVRPPPAAAWFGVQPYYVHGIQMLPVTPISEQLLESEWLDEETAVYQAACDPTCVKQGWSVPLQLAKAVSEPAAALSALKRLPADVFANANAGGNGNSRTAAYYWVATRPAA
jgi:endo-1,3(4)-beta-glucanase